MDDVKKRHGEAAGVSIVFMMEKEWRGEGDRMLTCLFSWSFWVGDRLVLGL